MQRNFNIVRLLHDSLYRVLVGDGGARFLWKPSPLQPQHTDNSHVLVAIAMKRGKHSSFSSSQSELALTENHLCVRRKFSVDEMMYQKAFKESRTRNSSTSHFSDSSRTSRSNEGGCDRRVAALISCFVFVVVIAIVVAVLVLTKK
jgi:hypothetical protein